MDSLLFQPGLQEKGIFLLQVTEHWSNSKKTRPKRARQYLISEFFVKVAK